MQLEHLPSDLLIAIASLCNLDSIQQLSFVSKYFCSLSRDDRLWKYIAQKNEITPLPVHGGGDDHSTGPWRSAVLKTLGNKWAINRSVGGFIEVLLFYSSKLNNYLYCIEPRKMGHVDLGVFSGNRTNSPNFLISTNLNLEHAGKFLSTINYQLNKR